MSWPVVMVSTATPALTWWHQDRLDFELSVWRGITIDLIIGLVAPSVFGLLGTIFYFLAGKEFPVLDRVNNPW